MINPNDVSTVRVGQLADASWNLTDQLPHEVGSNLKRGTVQGLSDFIALQIGASSSVAFRAVTVLDGETLPNTTQEEWILVGKGTFFNVSGGATIVCTEELNALMSNGTFWSIGVEIPITADLIGITQLIRSGYTQTAPSENAVYNALLLKANLIDIPPSVPKITFIADGITSTYDIGNLAEITAVFINNGMISDANWNQTGSEFTIEFMPNINDEIKPI